MIRAFASSHQNCLAPPTSLTKTKRCTVTVATHLNLEPRFAARHVALGLLVSTGPPPLGPPACYQAGSQHVMTGNPALYPHGGAAGASLLAPFSCPGLVALFLTAVPSPMPCVPPSVAPYTNSSPRRAALCCFTSKKRCNTLGITGPDMRPALLGGSARNPSRSTGTPRPPLMGDGSSPPASPSSTKIVGLDIKSYQTGPPAPFPILVQGNEVQGQGCEAARGLPLPSNIRVPSAGLLLGTRTRSTWSHQAQESACSAGPVTQANH